MSDGMGSPRLQAVLYRLWPREDGKGVRLEYLSDGADGLLELPADELAERFNTARLPLSDVDEAEFYKSARESLANHTPWRVQFGYVGPKSGTRRWLQAADFPHRTSDGGPYFVGVLTDLTDCKRELEEAEAAYGRLAAHLNNVPLAVVEWDDRFRVTRWSAEAETLFGWTAAEMIGRHSDDLPWVHPSDRGRVERAMATLLAGLERKTILVNHNLSKAGRELVVEWHTSALYGADGRAKSFLSFARDLTTQSAVERELMLADERLRTALRATHMLVWDVDRQSSDVYFSDHCGEFHGVPEVGGTLTTAQVQLVVHPDDRERMQAEIAAAITRDDTYQIEYRGAAPAEDGSPRWFVSTGRVVHDATGEWVRRVGVIREVTAVKRAEAERAELDRQLNEARRYESLGVLAGGIAHDFNNLLTVIIGNAEVLRMHATPAMRQSLTDIDTACKRASHLCSQMTAYAGVGRMSVGPVDLAPLLRQLEPTLKVDTPGVRLAVFAHDDLPQVLAEPFQVRQAVRNLVTNAGEATPAGGWVKVEAERRSVGPGESGGYVLAPTPGEYVAVRVTDSGTGMTPEVKAKAFDPFFSTRFAGRGLGLAAVLGIVRGHRGGVRLTSTPDRGTIVELYFPLAPIPDGLRLPSPPGEPTPVSQTEPPLSPTPASSRGTVLVCDDEMNIRELIANVLEGDGFVVVPAKDGIEGVQQFHRDPQAFSLAVVDLLMPGLGGHDVIRRLRQLRPGLPVVLVSGFADRALPDDVQSGGPVTILRKPFRLDHMSAAVAELARPIAVNGL